MSKPTIVQENTLEPDELTTADRPPNSYRLTYASLSDQNLPSEQPGAGSQPVKSTPVKRNLSGANSASPVPEAPNPESATTRTETQQSGFNIGTKKSHVLASINKDVDTDFTRSSVEELAHFTREMQEFRERSRNVRVQIGVPEEKSLINRCTQDMCSFSDDIRDTTQTQHKEINDLKSFTLDMFSLVEECRSQEERNKDKKYHHLLQSRPLDPGSARKMKNVQQQYQFVESGVRDIDLVLNHQWDEYQANKKQTNRRVQTPTTDSLYRVVRNNHNLILSEQKKLENAQQTLKRVGLYNSTSQWDRASGQVKRASNISNEKEISLSSLADSLLEEVSSASQSQTVSSANSSLSRENENKLRDFLMKRPVSKVKSTRPDFQRIGFRDPVQLSDNRGGEIVPSAKSHGTKASAPSEIENASINKDVDTELTRSIVEETQHKAINDLKSFTLDRFSLMEESNIHVSNEKEISWSSLADSLLEVSSASQSQTVTSANYSLSRENEDKLPDFLMKRPVSKVKSTRPGLEGTVCDQTFLKGSLVHKGRHTKDVMRQKVQEAGLHLKLNEDRVKQMKPGECLYVGQETLLRCDLEILLGRQWLNGKIINAFLHILMVEHSEKVLVLSCFLATLMDSEQTNLWQLWQTNLWQLKKVKVDAHRWILMPINVAQSHWVLLVANVCDGSVAVLDSSNCPQSKAYIGKWITYMNTRAKSNGEREIEWKGIHIESIQQRDSFNCGPFVLMNAMAVLTNVTPSSLTAKLGEQMRPYVLHKLLESALH